MPDPKNFYFGMREDKEGMIEVAVVPKDYWNSEKCLSDQYYGIQSILPEFFEAEAIENGWYLDMVDNINFSFVKSEMEKVGFEFSGEVSAFIKSCADSEDSDNPDDYDDDIYE